MSGPDLSAIGVDAVPSKPSELAKKEDFSFSLEREKEEHDHTRRLKDQDLGAIGRFFGTRDNAITYLIAFLVLLSCGLVALFSYLEIPSGNNAVEFFKAIGFAGMGYLTGKSVEAKKET